MEIELTGKTLGKWFVVRKGDRKSINRSSYWWCKCLCGREEKEYEVMGQTLKKEKSIGCPLCISDFRKTSNKHKTHGMSKDALYRVWKDIIKRCENPNHENYHNYGGRGISICLEWRHNYPAFKEHIMSLFDSKGKPWSKGKHIDRTDNDGNYCYGNISISTSKENCGHKTTTHYITAFGETACLTSMYEKYGNKSIPLRTVNKRINKYGWEPERALTEPQGPKRGVKRYGYE